MLLAWFIVEFVFSILRISPGIVLGHIKLKVRPKIGYTKHVASTSDHDKR